MLASNEFQLRQAFIFCILFLTAGIFIHTVRSLAVLAGPENRWIVVKFSPHYCIDRTEHTYGKQESTSQAKQARQEHLYSESAFKKSGGPNESSHGARKKSQDRQGCGEGENTVRSETCFAEKLCC